MRAVEITEHGKPEVLKLGERPVPQPKAGEVLVRVAAAGVNRPDVLQRMGHYPVPPGASDIPGLEIAGEVAAVGEGVTRGTWATSFAPWCRAADMRSTARRPHRSACRSRGGSRRSRPLRCRKPSSPCGATCSTARGSRPARACSCRAAPPALASPRSRWWRLRPQGARHRGQRREVLRLRRTRRRSRHQLQDRGLRRDREGGHRRPRRRRDPRHGRRRLRRSRARSASPTTAGW